MPRLRETLRRLRKRGAHKSNYRIPKTKNGIEATQVLLSGMGCELRRIVADGKEIYGDSKNIGSKRECL